MMLTLVIGLLLILLALAGVPLFSIVAGVGLIAFHAAGIDTAAMTGEFYRLATFPSLIPHPMTISSFLDHALGIRSVSHWVEVG